MLDIQFILSHEKEVRAAIANKGFKVDFDRFLTLETQCRDLKRKSEDLRAERNRLAKATTSKSSEDEKQKGIAEGKIIREKIGNLESELTALETDLHPLRLCIPNVLDPKVPVGFGDANNIEVRKFGDTTLKPHFKDHVALGATLGIIDIERGARISGSRFYVLKGLGALLEQAIHRFVIDFLVEKGFTLLQVPVLVKDAAMVGTGFYPLGKEDAYRIEKDGLNLIGTSEVPITSYHQDEVLSSEELPKLYCGWTTCFRREAGTYGKDTHGLYRVHQFLKVEQVVLCKNSEAESDRMHQFILNNSEEILRKLGLAHRVCIACSGETGLGQVIKHEIETWMPSRNAYSETHSCSSYYDFQARRLNIRYHENGVRKFVHTLNNTAAATPRLLIPILEQFQEPDGSVRIPEVLVPYMRGIRTISKS